MKKMKHLLLTTLFGLSIGLVQAQVFEGIITMQAENVEASEKSTIKWTVKGEKQRLDYSMQAESGTIEISFYLSPNSGSITMVSGGTRQVIDMSALKGSPYIENIMVMLPQTETKTIAGHTTRKYLAKGPNGSIDVYVAEDFAMELPVLFSTQGVKKAMNENGINGIPLEIVARNNQGKVVFTQLITDIRSQQVNEGDVTAP